MADDSIQPASPTLSPEDFGLDRNTLRLLPQSAEELSRQSEKYEAGRQLVDTESPSPEMVKLGKQIGVPLESGIGTVDYMAYRSRSTPQERLDFLAQKYGAENIRMNSLGAPVVRTFDKATGKAVDRTVDPFDIGLKSAAGFIAEQGLGTAAAIAATRAGRPEAIASKLQGVPLVGKLLGGGKTALGKSLIGSSTFEATKVAQGAIVRAYDKPPIDLDSVGYNIKGDLLQSLEGAALVPLDAAGDMGMIKGGEGIQWMHGLLTGKPVSTPAEALRRGVQKTARKFAEETEASRLGREGLVEWEKEGIPAKPTIGMVTDIPFIAKAFGYMRKHAAGAAAGDAAMAEWDRSLREQQRFMLSQGNLRSLEEIGNDGILRLKLAYDAADKMLASEVSATKGKIAESSQKRVLDLFSIPKLPEMGYPWTETGSYLNSSASKTRDVFWDRVSKLYNDLYSHPLANDRIIPTGNLIARVKKLKSGLPSAEQTVSEIGYDTYGSPFEIESVEKVPLKEYVPDGVLSKMNDLLKLEGQKTSITDLKEIRTELNNSIKRSQAFGQVKDHYLSELASAVDQALQEGINSTGDKSLRTVFDRATSEYKAGIPKFKDKLLARLWAHPDEVAVDNGTLFNSIENSPSRYKSLVNFFGKDSEGTRAFQQTVVKKLLMESLADGSARTIDIPTFLSKAQTLSSKNGQLFKDTIGSKFQMLEGEQRVLGELKGAVDIEAMQGLLSGNPPDRAQIRKLIQLEKTRSKLYQNSVVKQFVQGQLGVSSIHPEDFVRSLSEANLKDVGQVMSILENGRHNDYILDLRVKTLQTMFRKAQREATSADRARSMVGDPTYLVSTEGLQRVMGSDEQQAVYKRILGPEMWTRLGNYLKETLLEEQQTERARQAGFIASAASTSAGIKAFLNPLSKGSHELTDFAKYKLLSIMMARDWGVEMLSSLGKPLPPPIIKAPLSQRAMANLVASGTFLGAVTREFEDPMTRFQVLAWLKRQSGLATEESAQQPMMTPEQFNQGGPAPQQPR